MPHLIFTQMQLLLRYKSLSFKKPWTRSTPAAAGPFPQRMNAALLIIIKKLDKLVIEATVE